MVGHYLWHSVGRYGMVGHYLWHSVGAIWHGWAHILLCNDTEDF